MSSWHDLRLVDVADAVRRGELTAEQLTRAQLERIERLQPTTQAFSLVLAETALERARALDQARHRGLPSGPLHGVPIAIKDLLDLAGTPTSVGGKVLGQQPARTTATTVRRLLQAGAVIVGKLRLTEGAFSDHHPDLPAPRNPWGAELWTGVSSSGSGVATAARLCHGSLGTDTGGSIRFPSAACGLVGIKPSYGRVSRHGAFPLGESLDHIGPMTRSVVDAARMLDVLAGHDAADPNALRAPVARHEQALDQPAAGMVVGWDPRVLEQGIEDGVAAALVRARERLHAAGVRIRECRLPDARALVDGWAVTCAVEAALAHRPWFPHQRQAYGPVLAALLDLGLRTDGCSYTALERARERYRRDLDRVLAEVDGVLLPAMPFLPPRLQDMEAVQHSGLAAPVTFTAPFNYSGHPSVTLPAEVHDDGRPTAVQLVGARLGEPALLRLAGACEVPWQAPPEPG